MTKRAVTNFFASQPEKYTADGNKTFWAQGHKVGYVLFNGSLITIRDTGERFPQLVGIQAVKDISEMIQTDKGLFVGSKAKAREARA